MTRAELVQEITDALTMSHSLSVTLPDQELNRIIKNTTRWFYDNYNDATYRKNYIVPHAEFTGECFKGSRTIAMPDEVTQVDSVKEMNGAGRIGNIDRDFSDNRLIASEIFLNNAGSDNLVYRTAQYAYYDLSKMFFVDEIRYDWNKNTKNIHVLGRDPRYNVVISAFVKIPEEKLYDDVYFINFCIYESKIALGSMLGFFTYQLPGGVTVNYSDMKSDGITMLQELKERIDNESPPSWFLYI